jgi:xanthine dehydrogenase accessory factor
LVHPEAELSPGTKVGDVDPRGSGVDNSQVSDKSLAVGGGVLEALLRLKIWPSAE